MSARDMLMHIAFRETYDGKAQDLRDTIDAFAHELAEEIRDLGGIWDSSDMMDAADAIDPKMEKK